MKKRLIILSFLATMLLPWTTRAQVTCDGGDPVTVSNADTSTSSISYIPAYSLYNYSYSEVIILADEIAGIGDIKGLQFKPTSTNGGNQLSNCEIYMANTALDDLSSGFSNASDFELVWSGDLGYTTTGWRTVVFDDDFQWDGVSNIVVAVRRNTGTWSGTTQFASYTAGAQLACYVYEDGSPYTMGSVSGGTPTNNVPWYRLIGCEGITVITCFRVRNLTATDIDSASVTLHWVDTLNSGATYTVAYWAAGSTDTSYEYNVTDTFAVISGLNSSTQYFFAVTPDCGDGSTVNPTTASFRTTCGQAVVPFVEGFEGLPTMAYPECWDVQSGMIYVRENSSNAHSGSNYLDFRGNSGENIQTVLLPPMDQPTGDLQVRFWTRPESFTDSYCGTFSVGYINDSNSFVELANWSYDSFSAYEEKEVPMIGAPDNARIALRHNGNANNWYWYVDDLVVEPIPACARPLSVSASNIVEDGADINITGVDGSSYRIYWYLNDTIVDSADVADSVYSITGLNTNTVYTVRAVTVCDDGSITSPISGTFRTGCGIISVLPYSTDFDDVENGEVPPCWTAIQSDGSGSGTFPSVYNYSTNSYSSPNYFEFESSTGATEIVALPQFDDISQKSLSFYASVMNQNFVLEVGVLEDTDFVVVDTVNLTVGSNGNWHNSYHPYTVYFANYSGSGNRMAMRVTGTPGSSYTLMMDDFEINDFEGCYPVSNLSIDDITPDGMTLSWEDDLNSGATYNIYYRASGNSQDTFTVSTTDQYYTFSGLENHKKYYFSVSVDCGDGESTVSSTIDATTLYACPRPTGLTVDTATATDITISWTPGYEETEWLLGIGDSIVAINTNPYTITGLEPNTNYSLTLRSLCSSGDTSSQYASLTTRTDCLNGSCNFTVNATDSYGDGWNGNTLNFVQGGSVVGSATFSSGNTATMQVQVCSGDSVTITYTSGNYADEMGGTIVDGAGVVVFTIANMDNHSSGDVLASVADPCPSCLPPTAFAVTTSADTASFNWTGDENCAWELVYGTTGFALATATTIPLTVSNYEVSGLADGFYQAYVRTNCLDDDSPWVGPVDFSIGVDVVNINQMDTLYTCNAIIYDNGGATGDYTTYCDDQIVIYPAVEGNGLTISGISETETTWDYLTIYEGVGTSGTVLFQDNLSDVYSTVVGPIDVVGPVTINFHSDGSTNYPGFALQVSCFDLSCVHPFGVAATGVTSDNATVVFTGSSTGNYIVTITDGASYTDTVNVYGDSSYTFTTLSPLTTYQVSVFTDCGDGLISDPTSISFTTTDIPDMLPYSTGFEVGQDVDWMIFNGTCTNKWYIDSAVNNGGSRSIYISNDGGISNSYSNSSESHVYATKLLAFDSVGDYVVSYDWKCQGESSNYDWLRVFLAPATVSFTPGSAMPLGSGTYAAATAPVPADWVELTGKTSSPYTLSQSNNWNNVTVTFSLAATGNYYFVLMWSNDGSGGTNPPAAVDNVQIARLSCPAPQNIVIDNLTSSSATIQWTPAGSESEWEVIVDGTATIVSSPSIAVSNLESLMNYNVSIRAICGEGDTSFATVGTFTTDICDNMVYAENWDSTMSAGNTTYGPIGYSLYNYSYVQTIIDSSYMATLNGMDITAMSFNVGSFIQGSSTMFNNMTVYMANVSEASLSSGFIHPDSSHLFTKVIDSACFNYTESGWQVHGFDNSFIWDGHSNVLFAVKRDNGSYSGSQSFVGHSATGDKMRYAYRDSNPYDINTVSDGYTSNTVGNIRLISCGAGCATPSVTFSNIDAQSATVTAHGSGMLFELQYGTDDANLGNTMTSTTGVFNLTGLDPETQYYVAVRQQCDTNLWSNWRIVNFTTAELGCLAPDSLTVTATSYNSVSFSWTVGNEETAWEVHVFSSTIDTIYTVTTTTPTIGGLDADMTYNAAVRALCGANSDIPGPWSDTVTFSTVACQAVTDVSVTAGSTTATVTWAATGNSYRVVWGELPFNPQDIAGEASISTNNYVITGLDPETDYAVVIYNNCAEGLSVPSNPMNFTTTSGGGDPTLYTVTVSANNDAWGSVTGSGQYVEGSTATISATANEGYHFVEWDDHNTDNPRTFTVTGNMSFTAIFESGDNGIEDVLAGTVSLYPNPASTSVTLGLEGFEGASQVEVVDMNGRVVIRHEVRDAKLEMNVSELPQGAYFVRVTNGTRTAISKLIVK